MVWYFKLYVLTASAPFPVATRVARLDSARPVLVEHPRASPGVASVPLCVLGAVAHTRLLAMNGRCARMRHGCSTLKGCPG